MACTANAGRIPGVAAGRWSWAAAGLAALLLAAPSSGTRTFACTTCSAAVCASLGDLFYATRHTAWATDAGWIAAATGATPPRPPATTVICLTVPASFRLTNQLLQLLGRYLRQFQQPDGTVRVGFPPTCVLSVSSPSHPLTSCTSPTL